MTSLLAACAGGAWGTSPDIAIVWGSALCFVAVVVCLTVYFVNR